MSAQTEEEIIAALCSEAPTTAVRDCLRKYEPAKTAYQIEASLKKENKAVLVESLVYLGVPDAAEFKATALPHEMVCRIQNLFPDVCNICDQKYCVKLNEKPMLSCANCGQGCHNQCILQLLGTSEEELSEVNQFGASLVNPNASIGLFYLCAPCSKELIPNKENLKTKASTRRNTNNTGPVDIQDSESSQQTAVVSETSTEAAPPTTEEDENPSHDNSPETTNQNQSQQAPDPPSTRPICMHFKQGRCKHGISGRKEGTGVCNFRHPKICQRYRANGTNSRKGCNKGERCQFFHPQICHRSLKDRICLREDCKFLHIKGTRRRELQSVPTDAAVPDPVNHTAAASVTRPPREQVKSSSALPPSINESFLEQMKIMQEQILTITKRIQLLDHSSQLCQPLWGNPFTNDVTRPYTVNPPPWQPQPFCQTQQVMSGRMSGAPPLLR